MAHVYSHIELLRIEQLEDGIKARLLFPFSVLTHDNKVITVPEGFVTDFASVPPQLWWLIHPVGRYARAAVVHDYLYQTGESTKEEADHIFLDLMERLDVGWAQRTVMYKAVKWYGHRVWDRYREEDVV